MGSTRLQSVRVISYKSEDQAERQKQKDIAEDHGEQRVSVFS